MISAGQLIGVFVMCFVCIMGAYMFGHANGFDEGEIRGYSLGFGRGVIAERERQAMKDD